METYERIFVHEWRRFNLDLIIIVNILKCRDIPFGLAAWFFYLICKCLIALFSFTNLNSNANAMTKHEDKYEQSEINTTRTLQSWQIRSKSLNFCANCIRCWPVSNFFTEILRVNVAIEWSLKISPHIEDVATLLCEI